MFQFDFIIIPRISVAVCKENVILVAKCKSPCNSACDGYMGICKKDIKKPVLSITSSGEIGF